MGRTWRKGNGTAAEGGAEGHGTEDRKGLVGTGGVRYGWTDSRHVFWFGQSITTTTTTALVLSLYLPSAFDFPP